MPCASGDSSAPLRGRNSRLSCSTGYAAPARRRVSLHPWLHLSGRRPSGLKATSANVQSSRRTRVARPVQDGHNVWRVSCRTRCLPTPRFLFSPSHPWRPQTRTNARAAYRPRRCSSRLPPVEIAHRGFRNRPIRARRADDNRYAYALAVGRTANRSPASIAIAQLVEGDRVGLDDPVADFIPEFAQHDKQAVTLRHLLTHTAGLRFVETGWPQTTWSEIIERICQTRLEPAWIPGKRARYEARR